MAQKFDYMLLSRMQMDCDYFLGNGGRCDSQLHMGNVKDQITKMKSLWNGLPSDAKPEWLSMEEIIEYSNKMTE